MAHRRIDLVKYDAMMADRLISGRDLVWYGVDDPPFRLGGLPFRHPGGRFRRLPELPAGAIPEAVDMLAWHTSGATLAFKTDSVRICLRARLAYSNLMDHMTAVASGGFDLYLGTPGARRFCTVTRFPADRIEYSLVLLEGLAPVGMREYLLNFPLYSGVETVEIGLAPDAVVAPPTPWRSKKRIVFYGTSITQGGCASRPGMSLTGILSRRWNMEVVNLGFSGSGRGEPEVIELVAQVPDPALIVFDYAPNAGLAGLKRTLPGAVDIIRRHHPETPLALMTPLHFCRELLSSERAGEFREAEALMRSEVGRRRSTGDDNIHFVCGTAEEAGWSEYTVDGIHYTDLGFSRQADLVAPQLEGLL